MKHLYLVIAIVLMFSLCLTACGKKEESKTSASESTTVSATEGQNSSTQVENSSVANPSSSSQATSVSFGHNNITPENALDLKSLEFVIENVKTVYGVGAPISFSGVGANVVLNNANSTALKLTHAKLNIVTDYDPSKAGEYTVTVSYPGYDAVSYKVKVYDVPQVVDNTVRFKVDANAGEKSGKVVDGVLYCEKLSQAISLMMDAKYPAEATKIIELGKGEYVDKVNFALPNTVVLGDATERSTISYGDCSDTSGGTDNSATVSISGANFMAKNVIFKNSFDYINATNSNKQALAALVTSDKAVFDNCSFIGYQDTLEAKSNRAYYHNCTISGMTDFIFGNNSTSLFENCEIITRFTKANNANGGYVTAHKGNAGTNGQLVPKFGYVFKNCNLTAENGVLDGSVSLGRPWRADATVAYINCEMGAHISKTAYVTGMNSGARYVQMKGGKDANDNDIYHQPENAHFVEFGNTGSGAITEAVNGCTMLTQAQADEYTMANIFAKTNGAVTYADDWDAAATLATLTALK